MSNAQLNLQRVYVKGCSLELPAAPAIFAAWPAAQAFGNHLDVQISSAAVAERHFEVSVRATLTMKDQDRDIAVVEVEQAAVFEVLNVPPEALDEVLSVACAAVVYPYLRVTVADLMTRATLPVFHIPDFNWAQAFQARRHAEVQAAAASAPSLH